MAGLNRAQSPEYPRGLRLVKEQHALRLSAFMVKQHPDVLICKRRRVLRSSIPDRGYGRNEQMKNFAIASCIMVGFLIGAWFLGNREIPESRFMVTCAIFLCIWNLIEVHELKKLAKKFTGDQRPA